MQLEHHLRDLVRDLIAEESTKDAPLGFVSGEKLCADLGVTMRRLKTLRAHGLPHSRVGRDIYYELDRVRKWLRVRAASS